MSLAISGDTIAYLMTLGLTPEQMKGLVDRLQADALAMTPPALINGVNEERERLRTESIYAERKRVKDRERQRQLREIAKQSRDVAGGSRDIDGDPPATLGDSRGDPATGGEPSCTRVVIPSLPSLRSEEVGVGGVGSASGFPSSDDWPAGKADHHAKLLVEAVGSPWLDPHKSPDLVTTRGRIAAWKRDGASWEHDVLPVVAGLCANRRSRVSTWKFFDAAISRSIAENRAALEIPAASSHRPTGPPRSFDEKSAAAWDEATRRIAEDG